MALKYYDSPFHATHDAETASKMALKMKLSILIDIHIKNSGWTQTQAANTLGINQPRVSDLIKGKIELFTVDALLDMADKLGYSADVSMPTEDSSSLAIEVTQSATA